MSSSGRTRWESIVDRDMLGEPVSDEERAFRATYELEHPECLRELEHWDQMIDHLTTVPKHGASNRELTDRVLARNASGEVGLLPEPERRSGTRWVLGATAAAAAALGFAVTAEQPAKTARTETGAPEPASAPATAVPPTPRPVSAPTVVLASAGSLRVDGHATHVGARITTGQTLESSGATVCLQHDRPFAAVCLAPHTVARVASWSAKHRELALQRGRVLSILDTLPQGQRYTVSTESGSVTAVGTVFAVEVDDHGTASAQVLEGTVELDAGQGAQPLHARQQSVLGGEVKHFDPATAPSQVPVRIASLWRETPSSVLALSSEPSGADLSVDGIDLGSAPVTIALVPGAHTLEVSRRGRQTVTDEVLLWEGDSLSRRYALERPAKRPARTATTPLDELVARAREARASGRWSETERLYRQIITGYPGTSDAHVHQGMLGDLLLDDLGDPRGALRAYDAYLSKGGDISLEAGLGRIRALRQLGRGPEELRAIEEFLAGHPKAARAAELRARAEKLR